MGALCLALIGHWDDSNLKDPVLVLRELSSIWYISRLVQVHCGANLSLILIIFTYQFLFLKIHLRAMPSVWITLHSPKLSAMGLKAINVSSLMILNFLEASGIFFQSC